MFGIGGSYSHSNSELDRTTNRTENRTAGGTEQTQQYQRTSPLEDPAFAGFRQALIPFFGQQLSKAQQPVYGDAQKASFMGGLNDLAKASIDSLTSSLAKRGITDSGAAAAGIGDIENKRFGSTVDFISQLPFMEQQAQAERVNPLLTAGMNFAGRAPVGQETTATGQTSFTQWMNDFINEILKEKQSGSQWGISASGGIK